MNMTIALSIVEGVSKLSYWSDWKVGAISDEEYTSACNLEDAIDKALVEKDDEAYENCEYYKDGCCILNGQLCNGCE